MRIHSEKYNNHPKLVFEYRYYLIIFIEFIKFVIKYIQKRLKSTYFLQFNQ
jgi:hypothetical protein